jgi:L-iditol 2-dehydrogenase
MKALVLEEYSKLVYKDVPDPQIAEDEVLIKVKACGICGSDVHGMDGSSGRRQPPIIMGHEASGIIAEVGPKVTGWQKGERVTFDSTVYCGSCWHCRRGEINLCDNRRVLGVSCDEYRRHGAFAEYIAVPCHILYRLPEGVGFAQATMVEALSVAVHAANRTPVKLNDSVLVVGAGNIGLLAIQVFKAFGCNPVIAADIDESKLEWARKAGADVVINSSTTDLGQEVRKYIDRGVDVAVEAVGVTAAIQSAIDSLRKGGNLTLIGNVTPTVEFPLQSIVIRQISVNGSCGSSGEYPTCLDMITRKAVDVDIMISAVAPLAEGANWFKRLYEREQGLMKVILLP